MLKINNRKHEINIVGDSETLKKEIGTLMLALCGEAAKHGKEAAIDVYTHLLRTLASISVFLKEEHNIDPVSELEKEDEPEEKASVSDELDDAIESFFSALDAIIEKKKGDK